MIQKSLALLCLVSLVGCGDNELGLQHRRPNSPPETTLASGPPDSSLVEGTVYKVQLFWSGSDRDGTVDHFDFIMVDHPALASHIDSLPDEPDDPTRVVVEIPMPDDPRWTGTSATDSTFITLADTLRRNPWPGPGEVPDDVRATESERWHTFFVRAVDNEGAVDPTPDYRSFNSKNIAPLVWLTAPIVGGSEFNGPPVIVFNWDGFDAVGDGTSKEPVASRFVIITTPIDIEANEKYLNFPDSLYTLPVTQNVEWSPWRRWDAQDRSGRRAIIRDLKKKDEGAGFYLFAVQALDEAGGVTPVFDHLSSGKNNVARVRVSGAVGPILTVREEFLGTYTFQGDARLIELDIAAGQPLNFQFSADATHYGGEIVAYRYAWNLRNPATDEWDQEWSANIRNAQTRSFSAGTQQFLVETRDIADQVTSAEFKMTVHTVTRARDLLWVDDTNREINLLVEAKEDARWLGILHGLSDEWGFLFDESQDVFDVVDNRGEEPPIEMVFNYKSVIWTTQAGPSGVSALRSLALFFDPIPERNRNAAKSFNYLNIYLANQGSIWVSGFRPARSVWPSTGPNCIGCPVNVTNWDDPFEPHPNTQGVGRSSFLYAMGVEMFDVGSAIDSPRRSLRHFCEGFRRATAPSATVLSSVSAAHTHELRIPGSDADASLPQLQDRTYKTINGPAGAGLEHEHSVTITRADFLELREGLTITVMADSVGTGDVEAHTHAFEITDPSGVWGSPVLNPGLGDWPNPPSLVGRVNVEIYNMPSLMLQQQPPLVPREGISTVPYQYVSGVRQGPEGPFYPATADRQPAVILAKQSPLDPFFTRAFCGFEPFLLTEASHRDFAEYIVVRNFRLGYFDR